VALKTSDIKKRVIGGTNVKWGPAGLFVNEYGGEMWASNKYWLTRAERVAPLLEQFNLSAAEPGAYEVNGTVRRANGGNHGEPVIPDIASFMSGVKDYQPGIPVRVAGQQAYTRQDGFGLYAAFMLADGTHAGLEADTLAWLSDTMTAPLPKQEDGTYLHYGDVSVLFRKSAGVSALIRAEVVHVIERAHYTDKVEGQAQEHVPAVTELLEPRVLGIMLGMKYGA
jgi:hypothetical protein